MNGHEEKKEPLPAPKPRKTLLLIQEHLTNQIAIMVEAYLCISQTDRLSYISTPEISNPYMSSTEHINRMASFEISKVAEIGYWEMMDDIIANVEKGGSPYSNARIKVLNNLLYGSVLGDSIELVQYLVEKGATTFDLALNHSCYGQNTAAAQLMITHGARLDAHSIIFATASRYSPNHVLGVLLSNVIPNQITYDNILEGGLLSENMAIISFAVSGGAELSRSLYTACRGGNLGLIVLSSIYDKDYLAGLNGACRGNQVKVAKMMLSHIDVLKEIDLQKNIYNIIKYDSHECLELFDTIRPLDLPWSLERSLSHGSNKCIQYIIKKYENKVRDLLEKICVECSAAIKYGDHKIMSNGSSIKLRSLFESGE